MKRRRFKSQEEFKVQCRYCFNEDGSPNSKYGSKGQLMEDYESENGFPVSPNSYYNYDEKYDIMYEFHPK